MALFALLITMGLARWDWPYGGLTNYSPSVLLHCWLGHQTRKIVPDMTYNVFNWWDVKPYSINNNNGGHIK